jgi:hypothetical protein
MTFLKQFSAIKKVPMPHLQDLSPMVIWFFKIAAWACVILIALLSLVPGEARPHAVSSGQLEHIVAYAGTAALFATAYPKNWQTFLICVLLPSYSVGFEILQTLVPGRSPQLLDMMASSAGCWAGVTALVCTRSLLRSSANIIIRES